MKFSLQNLVSMRKKFNKSFRRQKQQKKLLRTRAHHYKQWMLRALLTEGKTHCLVAVGSKVPPYLRHGWMETALPDVSVLFSHGSPINAKLRDSNLIPLAEVQEAIDTLVGHKCRLTCWDPFGEEFSYCLVLKTLKV